MKKFILILMMVSLISMANASPLNELGFFKKGTDVRISQICSDATYINISSITYPNSSIAVSDIEMEYIGNGEYSYTFNLTDENGRYDVRGISDGCSNSFATYFEITLNGKEPADGIIVVAFSIIFMLTMAFGLVYFFISLGHVVQFDMDLIDAVIMISNYLALWAFYYISFEYLGNPVMNDLLETIIDVGAVTHVFLPVVGFMVSFIMTNLKFNQKAKVTY